MQRPIKRNSVRFSCSNSTCNTTQSQCPLRIPRLQTSLRQHRMNNRSKSSQQNHSYTHSSSSNSLSRNSGISPKSGTASSSISRSTISHVNATSSLEKSKRSTRSKPHKKADRSKPRLSTSNSVVPSLPTRASLHYSQSSRLRITFPRTNPSKSLKIRYASKENSCNPRKYPSQSSTRQISRSNLLLPLPLLRFRDLLRINQKRIRYQRNPPNHQLSIPNRFSCRNAVSTAMKATRNDRITPVKATSAAMRCSMNLRVSKAARKAMEAVCAVTKIWDTIPSEEAVTSRNPLRIDRSLSRISPRST